MQLERSGKLTKDKQIIMHDLIKILKSLFLINLTRFLI